MVFQHVINGVFHFLGVAGQGDEFFGPAVHLTTLIVHDALSQSLVSRILFGRLQGGVHIQAAGVCLLPVLRKHELPHGFCNELGMDAILVLAVVNFERLGFGF